MLTGQVNVLFSFSLCQRLPHLPLTFHIIAYVPRCCVRWQKVSISAQIARAGSFGVSGYRRAGSLLRRVLVSNYRCRRNLHLQLLRVSETANSADCSEFLIESRRTDQSTVSGEYARWRKCSARFDGYISTIDSWRIVIPTPRIDFFSEGNPMRSAVAVLILTSCFFSVGCHCCGVTECYADHIDDCSDRNVCLDRLYCERLDVTRWCMSGRCRNCR